MNNRLGITVAVVAMLVVCAAALAPEEQAAAETNSGVTTRVSVDSADMQGNNSSNYSAISADGRFVAFYSYASNLVPGDTNGGQDVFVHDRQTGLTSRVSIDSTGAQMEGISGSSLPAISADGRIVAFESYYYYYGSSVFVHDRQTGATSRISVSSTGTPGDSSSSQPALSADGRFVAFMSYADNLVPDDTNQRSDIFVHDRRGGTTRVSVDSSGAEANGYSVNPAISADGRFVAFESQASNLIPGDINHMGGIFLHDRQTGATTRISVDSSGAEPNGYSGNPAISADGRFVAFSSYASNLVPGDTNGAQDAFVHDRLTGTTSRVSVDSNGEQAQGHFSSYDYHPAISADGRYVAFMSLAPNLVAGDTNGKEDIFVYDRVTGEPTLVSRHTDKTQGNDRSDFPSISGDGRLVAFNSMATTLVDDDTNNTMDVFVHDRGAGSGSVLGETSVAPFLAIPFSLAEGETDPLQNWNLGRINSWFDHTNPRYQTDRGLRLYDPAINVSVKQGNVDGRPCYSSSMIAPRYCYEGHDGIDFKPSVKDANDTVLAAATGTVVTITKNCCAGLGNNVILYHIEGYFTRYGHLKDVGVSMGQTVNSGDAIGTMGTTGNSTGVHLHFSVYQDVNGNEAFDDADKVVDPFGYNWPGGPETDPWVVDGGPYSYLLWLSKAPTASYSSEQGTTISNATETVTITIPPDTFPGAYALRLDEAPPISEPSSSMRSAGKSLWVRFIEWLLPGNVPVSRLGSDSSPISVSVDYSASAMAHLDEQQLVLVQWDEVNAQWLVLPTTVDAANNSLIGEATDIGHFDIQAPLICPTDITEPDDDPLGSVALVMGVQSAERLFDIPEDEDWFSFEAVTNKQYMLNVETASNVSAMVELFDADNGTLLSSGIDGLTWTGLADHTYYFRLSPFTSSVVGCSAEYQLTVVQSDGPTPTPTVTSTTTPTASPTVIGTPPTATSTSMPTVIGTPPTPTTTPTVSPTPTATREPSKYNLLLPMISGP